MKTSRGICLLFIVFLLITGCSKEHPVLTFAAGGAPNEVDYWESLIKKFEKTTNVKVDVMRQPTDTDQRRQGLVIPLKAKQKDPDVFLMDVIWVGQFAASDWLLPIDSYLKESDLDISTFFSSIIQQVDVHTGRIVALPVYNDCGLLYYRKDLLRKYNLSVPHTWHELAAVAEKIQKQERNEDLQFYGFVWQGAQYEGLLCTFLEFAHSHGGGLLDDEGNVSVHRQENVEALQFMHDLIHEYEISPPNTFTEMKEEEVRLFFENGNALFERNWPYAWGLHERDDSSLKGKVGIVMLPKSNEGEAAATLGGWHIGISRYSDDVDNAWRLVEFIVSYAVQKELALVLGWNPGRGDIYDDQEMRERIPHINVLKSALNSAVARPNLPYYTQVSEILQRYLNAALSGNLTPAKALEESQTEIEKIVKAYHE